MGLAPLRAHSIAVRGPGVNQQGKTRFQDLDWMELGTPHSARPSSIRIENAWDFPGGAVVKTPRSQCRGPGFDPWSMN